MQDLENLLKDSVDGRIILSSKDKLDAALRQKLSHVIVTHLLQKSNKYLIECQVILLHTSVN